MNKFSQAYDAARTALGTDAFAGGVALQRAALQSLMADGGPSAAQAEQLGKLRQTLKTEQWKLVAAGKGTGPNGAAVQAILDAAGSQAGKPERVATVKMLRHLYHAKTSGGQDVNGDVFEQPREAGSAFVGDQQDAVTAAPKLRGQRMGRNHVPAGAPGGQDEIHAVSDSPLHFTT